MKTTTRITACVLLYSAFSLFAAVPGFTPDRFQNTIVSVAAEDQYYNDMCPASLYSTYNAGQFIVFRDDDGYSNGALRIARVSDTGTIIGPIEINSDNSASLSNISVIPSGVYAFVCWQRGTTIYMAKRYYSCTPYAGGSWSGYATGKPIISTTGSKSYVSMVPDGSNGAIICWREYRGSYYRVFVQRVDYLGNPKWGVNGREVCQTTGFSMYKPRLISDGVGGAIVVWYDSHGTTGHDIYAQRVSGSDSLGFSLLWGSGGVGVSTPMAGDQYIADICSDDSAGLFVAFQANLGTSGEDIYVQRININGSRRNSAGGALVCGADGDQKNPAIVAFSASEYGKQAYIAWQDYRDSASVSNIYACRAYCSGLSAIYTSSYWNNTMGKLVCNAPGMQSVPLLVLDSVSTNPGVVLAWSDERSGTSEDDIYAARFDYYGNAVAGWTDANGISIAAGPAQQGYSGFKLMRDQVNNNDLKFLWVNYTNASNSYDLLMQKENMAGTFIDRTPPSAPTLYVEPDQNDNTPYLDWTTASGATMYFFQFSTSSSFTPLLFQDSLTASAITLPVGYAGNGTYYWRVRCRDIGGNYSSYSSTGSFRIDTLAPYWSNPSITDGDTTSDRTPSLSATFNDLGSVFGDYGSIVMKLDGATVSHSRVRETISFTPAANLADLSWHRATWFVRDSVGNGGVNDTFVVNFFVNSTMNDLTPPNVKYPEPVDGGLVNVRRPLIRCVASDASKIDPWYLIFKIDNTVYPATFADGYISYTPTFNLTDGSHAIFARIADSSTNHNLDTLIWTFKVDATVPAKVTFSAAIPHATKADTIAVSGTAENKSTVYVYWGAGNYQYGYAATGAFSFNVPLNAGANMIYGYQRDSAGNYGAYDTIYVNQDKVSPDAPIVNTTLLPTYTTLGLVDVQGTGENKALVRVYNNGGLKGSDSTDASGAFIAPCSLAAGNNQITALQIDSVGNTGSYSTAYTVVRDNSIPVIDSVYPADFDTLISQTPTVWAALHDAGAAGLNADSLLLYVDGVKKTATWDGTKLMYAIVISLADQAWHYLKVRAVDQAGNSCAWDSTAFYVDRSANDNIPPVISNVAPAGVVTIPRPSVSANAIDNENGLDQASIKLLVDNTVCVHSFNAGTGQITWTPSSDLAQGAHRCSLYVADASANRNNADTAWSFLIDSDPPSIPVLGSIASPTRQTSVTVTGTTTPLVSVDIYRNASATPITSTTSSPTGTFSVDGVLLEYGNNSLTAKSIDSLGNTSTASTPVTVVMDNVAPYMVSASPNSGDTIGITTPIIAVTVSDSNGTGINPDSAKAFLDGTPIMASAVSYAGNVFTYRDDTRPLSPDSLHAFALVLQDLVGNVSDTQTVYLFVDTSITDTVRPAFSLRMPRPDTTINSSSAAISVQVSDISGVDAATVRMELDNVAVSHTFASGQVSYSASGLGEGRHSVKAVAADLSSNANTDSIAWNFTIDTRAPLVPVVFQAGTPTNSPNISVMGTAEKRSQVTLYRNAVSAGVATTGANDTFTVSLSLTEGENRITAEARDTAGNVSTKSAAMTVMLDTRQPEVSNITPANGEVTTAATPLISAMLFDSASGIKPSLCALYVINTENGDTVSVPAQTAYTVATRVISWQPQTDLADSTLFRIIVTAADSAGNIKTQTSEFTTNLSGTDQTPPQITAYQPTGTITSRLPAISAIVTDQSGIAFDSTVLLVDNIPVSYALDTAASRISYQATVAMAESVTHTIELKAYDAHYNSRTQGWSFVIDATAPAAPVITSIPSLTKNASISISGTAESRAKIEVTMLAVVTDTGSANVSGAFSVTGVDLAEGSNSISLKAVDAAGNKSAATTPIVVVRDSKLPYLVSLSPAAAETTSLHPSIAAQVSDSGSGIDSASVVLLLDGDSIATSYSAGRAVPDSTVTLSNGNHTVAVIAADRAGNLITTTSVQFFADSAYVDNVPPSFSNMTPAHNSKVGDPRPEISVTVSDASSDIDSSTIELQIINGPPAIAAIFDRAAGTVTYRPSADLDEGWNFVQIIAADGSGNADTLEWRFWVDITPPDAPAFLTSQDTLVSDDMVTLRAVGAQGASLDLYRDSAIISEMPALISDTVDIVDVPLHTGENLFWLVARDDVDNESAPSDTLRVIYNTAAPVIANNASDILAVEDSAYLLQIVASDADGQRLNYTILRPVNADSLHMSIDSNGLFAWNPEDPASDVLVRIMVDDGYGYSDTITLSASASAVNDPPVFTAAADTIVTIVDSVRIAFTVADDDNATLDTVGVLGPYASFMRVEALGSGQYELVFFADSAFSDTIHLFAFDGSDTTYLSFFMTVDVTVSGANIDGSDTTRIVLADNGDTVRLVFPPQSGFDNERVAIQKLTPAAGDTLPNGIELVGGIYSFTGPDSGFTALLSLPVPALFAGSVSNLMIFRRENAGNSWQAFFPLDSIDRPGYVCAWLHSFSHYALGLDSTAPEVVIDSVSGSYRVYGTITENIPNPAITLSYREPGEAPVALAIVAATVAGTASFSASIPSAFVSNADYGFEYWLSATDGIHTAASKHRTVGKTLASASVPSGTVPAAHFTMVSLPFDATEHSPDSVFAGLITSDTLNWRIGRWQASGADNGVYIDHEPGSSSSLLSMAPGTAVWVYSKQGQTQALSLGAARSTPLVAADSLTQAYPVVLRQGWNQIGNPFAFTVNAADVILDTNTVQRSFYAYNSADESYASADSLKPYNGYWVFASAPDTILFPSLQPGTGSLAKQCSGPGSWNLTLSIKQGKMVDAIELGETVLATDARDNAFDHIGPPPLLKNFRVSIPHPEWQQWASKYYMSDYRNSETPGNTWPLHVSGKQSAAKSVTYALAADNIAALPESENLFLLVPEGNVLVDLRKQAEFPIFAAGAKPDVSLVVIAGSMDYVRQHSGTAQELPSVTAIAQNHPNPFNPVTTIDYQLNAPARVTLVVYDMKGQIVKKLTDNAFRTYGYYTARWDGTDSRNTHLASGVYFYRLQAGSFVKTRKMLLVK